MANIIQVIKKAAIDAVEASKPHKFLYGTVESIDPLRVNIEQHLTLKEKYLILTSNVKDYDVEVSSIDGGKQTITIHNGLKVGEKVQLLRVYNGQRFVLLSRVVA